MINLQSPILAPSILAADYTRLGSQVQSCMEAGVQWIHCDIMDGHFVPNISFGPSIVKAAGSSATDDTFLDLHLMIENPDQYIEVFADAGAKLITVHQEVCPHLHRTIQLIKQQNIKTGVAVNPATPLQQLIPVLPYLDLVLIMSVNPGFGGQSFIESTYQKIQQARAMRENHNASYLIEVDGGLHTDNIGKVAKMGTDVFVAGSSVFKSGDIKSQIELLTKEINKAKNLYV